MNYDFFLLCYTRLVITSLTGIVRRLEPGNVIIDVHGVGYAVSVPIDVYEKLGEETEATLHTYTYVREDRLELFGFNDRTGLLLFGSLISMSGIGPKLGLELCAVSRDLLLAAIDKQDPSLLQNVKGIGKRTAEKLLVELKSLVEKRPDMFGIDKYGKQEHERKGFDHDAVEALRTLGYDTGTILRTLKELPKEIETTEGRVAAALRAM